MTALRCLWIEVMHMEPKKQELLPESFVPETGVRPKADPKHREYLHEIIKADVKELHKGPEQRLGASKPANEMEVFMAQNKKS